MSQGSPEPHESIPADPDQRHEEEVRRNRENKLRTLLLNSAKVQEAAKSTASGVLRAVSGVYTEHELQDFLPKKKLGRQERKELLEYEADEPYDIPHRPFPPGSDAPVEDWQEQRQPTGLKGVVGLGRGHIDDLFETFNTEERIEWITQLQTWFHDYREVAINQVQMYDELEGELKEGEEAAATSSKRVFEVMKEVLSQRDNVETFANELGSIAGGGSDALIGNVVRKKEAMKEFKEQQIVAKQEIEAAFKDMEKAVTDAKKDYFKASLENTKKEEEDKTELTHLELEVEQRRADVERLEVENEKQADFSRQLQTLLENGKKCLLRGEVLTAEDERLETLLREGRAAARKRQRHVRLLCPGIAAAENRAKENDAEAARLDFLASELKDAAESKEDLLETLTAQMEVVKSEPSQRMSKAEFLKAKLVEVATQIRGLRGLVEIRQRKRQAIDLAIAHCNTVRGDVRRHLQGLADAVVRETLEAEEAFEHTEMLPARLPSEWQKHLQADWGEVEEFPEIFSRLMFPDCFTETTIENSGEESVEPSRQAPANQAHDLEQLHADTEAIRSSLLKLEEHLTPSDCQEDAMLLMKTGQFHNLESGWIKEEELKTSRLQEMREKQHFMLNEAKRLEDSPPSEGTRRIHHKKVKTDAG